MLNYRLSINSKRLKNGNGNYYLTGKLIPNNKKPPVIICGPIVASLQAESSAGIRINKVGKEDVVGKVFDAYLKDLNDLPERRYLHWLEVCKSSEDGNWLRCAKCGYEVQNAERGRILHGVCDRDAAALQQVLDRPGDRVRFGSLNVGTLRHREVEASRLGRDVVAAQETCVSEAVKGSVAAATASGRHCSLQQRCRAGQKKKEEAQWNPPCCRGFTAGLYGMGGEQG